MPKQKTPEAGSDGFFFFQNTVSSILMSKILHEIMQIAMKLIYRSADGHASEGLPVNLGKGGFLRTWTGISSALTPARCNTWSGLLRALSLLLHIWQLCLSLCCSYQPENLPAARPFWEATHAWQPRLARQVPLDFQVAQVWMPSSSHTRQSAAGLSPGEARGVCTELLTAAEARAASLAKDREDRWGHD